MNRRLRISGLNARGLLQQGLGTTPAEEGTGDLGFPVVAGYEIRGILGRGGTGMVYEGLQVSVARPVAIKVLTREHLSDELLRQRLAREAQVMANLRHPNIVAVHDYVTTEEGGAGIVMELVAGPSLRQILRERSPLSVPESLAWAGQIASGLAVAHDAGLIHRDLKPENVLIARDGSAKVADFGIAFASDGGTRLTLTGMWLGTEGYMAPEQAEAQPVDSRCDVYSLGVVLYEMLNGELPRGRIDRTRQLCPHLPSALCDILVAALQPDREKRLRSMREFGDALQGVVTKPGDGAKLAGWRRLAAHLRQRLRPDAQA